MASAKNRRKKNGRFRKKSSSKRKSTRKGQIRGTSRRAYEGLKRKVKRKSNKPRQKNNTGLKLPKFGSTAKKIAVGLGAAQLAALVVGFIAPQYVGIAKPVTAFVAGGIPAVAAELVIDQGILSNIGGMFSGPSINDQRLAGGL